MSDAQSNNTVACPVCGLAVADEEIHYGWHIEQTNSPDQLRRVLRTFGKAGRYLWGLDDPKLTK